MTDWRVLLLSTIAFVTLLAGLLVLALPDPYEGRMLHAFDATHSVRVLDVLGVALLAAGGGIAWGAGLVWRRRIGR